MMMTQCIPFEGEIHFSAPKEDFFLESILQARPVPTPAKVRMPVIRVPRSVKQKYSDSEFSSAALMLEKLRKRRDVIERLDDDLPRRLDRDQVTDAVVEKLLEKLL